MFVTSSRSFATFCCRSQSLCSVCVYNVVWKPSIIISSRNISRAIVTVMFTVTLLSGTMSSFRKCHSSIGWKLPSPGGDLSSCLCSALQRALPAVWISAKVTIETQREVQENRTGWLMLIENTLVIHT